MARKKSRKHRAGRRGRKPGRRKGHRVSVATKRKISAALKRFHKTGRRKHRR